MVVKDEKSGWVGFFDEILCIHNELMSIPSTHNGDYEYSTASNHAKHGQISRYSTSPLFEEPGMLSLEA